MKQAKKKMIKSNLRAKRVRAKIRGTADVPRLCVKRSYKHISAQLIDDNAGKTIASSSDRIVEKKGKPVEIAKMVGIEIGNKAKEIGITSAVFDRGQYRYHGRVAAVADGAREAGIKI
ncbi:MAG: 50S ribosomal protein L18 [Patescibacteria group bacterium]